MVLGYNVPSDLVQSCALYWGTKTHFPYELSLKQFSVSSRSPAPDRLKSAELFSKDEENDSCKSHRNNGDFTDQF